MTREEAARRNTMQNELKRCPFCGGKYTVIPVHLCPTCLQEMAEYLRDKYLLNDVDYAGIQIDKMPSKEEKR